MNFVEYLNKMSDVLNSPESVNSLVNKLFDLAPHERLDLARKVINFQRDNIVAAQVLSAAGLAWTKEELSKASELVQAASKYVTSPGSTWGGIETSRHENQYIQNGTQYTAMPRNKQGEQSTVGAGGASPMSSTHDGLLLYNPWLTRLYRVATMTALVALLAVVGYVVYQHRETLGNKIRSIFDGVGQMFKSGAASAAKAIGYPFERDEQLLAEASKSFALLKFISERWHLREDEALDIIGAIRSIDVEKARDFLRIERRVKDVRQTSKDLGITASISFNGR